MELKLAFRSQSHSKEQPLRTGEIAHDLRAGAAMIIAGLIAEGQTEISDIHHILRGYENIIDKFAKLGAKIDYVKTEDDE